MGRDRRVHRTVICCDDEKLAMLVGAHLKQARIRAGLTSEHVALLLDSHRSVISRVESGKHVPELRETVKHWLLLDLPLEQLGTILDACVYRTEGGERALVM